MSEVAIIGSIRRFLRPGSGGFESMIASVLSRLKEISQCRATGKVLGRLASVLRALSRSSTAVGRATLRRASSSRRSTISDAIMEITASGTSSSAIVSIPQLMRA